MMNGINVYRKQYNFQYQLQYQFPYALCELYAYILVFHQTINAIDLYEKYKEHFFLPTLEKLEGEKHALIIISKILISHKLSLSSFNLPEIENIDKLLNEKSIINSDEINISINKLSLEQKNIYNYIKNLIYNKSGKKTIFIDGPGGCGKSFVINTVIQELEINYKEFICLLDRYLSKYFKKRSNRIFSVLFTF